MTEIRELPITQVITANYSRFMKDWVVISDIIGKFTVPAGFEFDWESVPLLRGSCKVGGAGHDYLSRFDSVPVVTKEIAAAVYLELMVYRKNNWLKRQLKYNTVRIAPNYFHKKSVNWKYEVKP